jgi:hypothetical protein
MSATISDFDPANDTLSFDGKVAGDVAVDTNGGYDGEVILSVTAADDTDVAITLTGMTAEQEYDLSVDVSSIIA